MIAYLTTLLNALAALSSALAAYFWYQASRVEAPGELRGEVMYDGPAIVDTRPLVEYAQESGRRNKIAALWSAAAALFAFLSWGLGLLSSPALAEELGDMDQKWACEVLASEHVSSDKCEATGAPRVDCGVPAASPRHHRRARCATS
jgi:hypothetical protein